MANIRIDLDHTPYDGEKIVFKAPCDAADVTGMKIYYGDTSSEYYLCDANGNNVGSIDNLFAQDALVTIILDTDDNKAFIQNADTNAYLENKFAGKEALGTAATKLNRNTNVNAEDTNYTTLMARGESLNSSETTPAVNGAIAWYCA